MIDVINLEKHFGDNEVLRGINVTIDKGDIMVVIGPSGSGKSTFLRCLNCMEDPTGGQIIFNGVDIADPKVDINIHRRHMGMVFQHFNLYNNKTVIQNIMLAPVLVRCQDLKKAKRHNRMLPLTNLFRKEKQEKIEITTSKSQIVAEARAKAEELLKRIGLEDKADVYPSTLSGGQKQRLCIARALLKCPKILILDDSTSAVDTATERAIREALHSEYKDMTKIIIAQRISSVEDADKIIVMDNGEINGIGTHEELLKNNEIYREVYNSQVKGGGDDE